MVIPETLQLILVAGILIAGVGYVSCQTCGCCCCCNNGGPGNDYCGPGCQQGPCPPPPPTTPTPTTDLNNNNASSSSPASPASPASPTSPVFSVSGIVTDAFFNAIIEQADAACPGKSFYSRLAFLIALDSYPQFGSRVGFEEDNRREIAAFFAHVTRQTRHFCYVEEIDGASKDYCDERNAEFPCVANKKYYGRGPIQISWNYNYGPAGKSIGFDGLNAPETVANDPVVAFKTALWFWTSKVQPVMGQGFGSTTRAIVGALECDGGNPTAVQARMDYYTDYCNQLRVAPGHNITC